MSLANLSATSSEKGSLALGMSLLMLLVLATPMASPLEESVSSASRSTYYTPQTGSSGVNTTSTGVLSVPYNQTFSGGQLDVTPMWGEADDLSARFGIDANTGWNGTHQGTQGIGHGGQLSLATQSTLATLTDFETLIETLPDWVGQGPNHNAWNVVPLTNATAQTGKPTLPTDGQRVLATQAQGGLNANMTGCLASPAEPIPAFVSRYNLTVDHWLAFFDDDAAWIEGRLSGGSWEVLTPSTPYTNASALAGTPANVWSGASNGWQKAHFSLDGVIQPTSTTLEVRFCFQTSSTTGVRNGWFLDNFTLSNVGDLPGAWFHGNMSGDYANNADGRLYLPADLSNFSGPMQIEFWANWDLEGSFYDNLLVLVSVNNGTTWAPVSGIPGLPGNGLSYQGNYYMDESLGWIPISYNLPSGVSNHQNASNVLLQFQVLTNYQNGFGGFASSGWEGIAIDDVSIIHRPGTSQSERLLLSNFSSETSGQYGDQRGWLDASISSINEWNWTTEFGMNPPQFMTNSFEFSMTTPPGWSIDGTWPDGWELGEIGNTSGYGPGTFHSGVRGAAINLTTKYTNNVYTHLVTEEYTVPTNATARLSFRSWVCTEHNWDGGGVSISSDGGQTWWWLPPQLNGFHDQISTANTNSPFFGEGILDGSGVPGGCGASNPRDFALKTYDLSNLSGQSIKARFSFFSDTFVEADGWYIDDAGIEIDVFEPVGTWTSPSISPDPLFGYGWLDGWFEQPNGTELLFDVLDGQSQPIPGHQNLTLPSSLALDPKEHPSVHVRVRMSTQDTYVTPLVHSMSLGRTTYIGPQHVLNTPIGASKALIDGNGTLVVSDSFSIPLASAVSCPHDGYRLTTVGDNLTWATTSGLLVASAHLPASELTYLNHSFGGDISLMTEFTLLGSGGERFVRAKAELDCVVPPLRPNLSIGWNNVSVMTWPPSQMSAHLGLNTYLAMVEHDGNNVSWAQNSTAPSISMNNTTLSLTYNSLDRSAQGSTSGSGPAMTFMMNNLTNTSEVYLDGVLQPTSMGRAIVHYQGASSCPVVASSRAHPIYNAHQLACTVSLEVHGTADVRVFNFMHMLPDTLIEVRAEAEALNSAKLASIGNDTRAIIDIPLHVQTDKGGLRVGLNATMLPLMVETVERPSYTRWLPEETVSFTTHHTRYNPLDATNDAPDISEVSLWLGPTADMSSTVIHVELDRIQEAPRFRQRGGAGLALLDASTSSVSCTLNTCSVVWAFTSTWLLDDIDDLHLFTMAKDDDGLEVGPEIYVRKTAFNEVENDLEVVDFTVTDASQRRIDDWTNSFWPYHLNHNESLVANGRVRMEGIANQWVDAGEAEVTVTLRSVPPKNLSGGPDEWTGEPVNWSSSWSTEVGPDGRFSIGLASPLLTDLVPSNTFLEITPSLSRRGPSGTNASSSDDRTVVLTPTRFLHDTTQPQVDSLRALDSGQEVIADGHISMYGKDVALRLQLSDPEGLSSVLDVWTWLEGIHDTNGDGTMDASEYTLQSVSLNRGVQQLEVDLPLVGSEQVVPDGQNSGRLSVVLKGEDLAGNPLLGGGDFGQSSDLATLSVQRRSDTILDVDNIQLDRQQGQLLAGHEHHFSFSLGDANGIESLESISLALLGETNETSCFIHYEPRFGEVEFDEECFVGSPFVVVQKRPLLTTYDVDVAFRLDWNVSRNLTDGGVPSLKVLDEGQDLGLGLYRLSALSWVASDDVELRWLNITDTQAPFGQHNESTHWFHRNDVVHHRMGLYHRNTSVLAEHFPEVGRFEWTLTDGERTTSNVVNLTTTGVMSFNATMNENVLYNDEGVFSIAPEGFDNHPLNALSYNLVVDDAAPKLYIAPGVLENFASNALTSVPITVSVSDDTHMPPEGIEMHTVFYRMGRPVEGTNQHLTLPLKTTLNEFTVYEGTVDFLPQGIVLTRSDVLIVWFNATDRSGRLLTGFGTESAPLNVGITWFAFEPVLTDLSATPFRPKVGENVSVYARVANDGLLPGEFQIILRDDEGRELDNGTAYLGTGEWVNFVWNVEAWKEGRLGLNLEVVDHTPQIPVPLADIQGQESTSGAAGTATLGLSVISLIVAGMVLFVVRQQRAQREEVYHLERIRRIVSLRRPPPKPLDIVDIPQEE
mgnify:FL=1